MSLVASAHDLGNRRGSGSPPAAGIETTRFVRQWEITGLWNQEFLPFEPRLRARRCKVTVSQYRSRGTRAGLGGTAI